VRKNIRYVLSIVLIVVMVCVLGYQYNWFSSRNAIVKYQTEHTVITSNKHLSLHKRSAIAEKLMYQTQANEGLTKQGFVSIPSVGILQPIFDDAYSTKGLNAGANIANRSQTDPEGKIKPQMGEGNYGLASHNFNDGKTGFSALQQYLNKDEPYLINGKEGSDKWLNGKAVYLANGSKIYKYKITGQTTVTKDDVAVLNPSSTAKVTIISCLFPSTDYRIITNAKLNKTWNWKTAPDQVVTYFDLTMQKTNAHASWFNPGEEEGVN
jgi:Sortase (surface protein transpeptidase)